MAIYMKYDGITGPVTAVGYVGCIELTSCETAVSRALTMATGGRLQESSVVEFGLISLQKVYDESSPLLWAQCLSAHHTPKVSIFMTTTSVKKVDTFLTYNLTEVLVASFNSITTGDRPTETLQIVYGTIEVKSSPLDASGTPKGGVTTGWNLVTNKRI